MYQVQTFIILHSLGKTFCLIFFCTCFAVVSPTCFRDYLFFITIFSFTSFANFFCAGWTFTTTLFYYNYFNELLSNIVSYISHPYVYKQNILDHIYLFLYYFLIHLFFYLNKLMNCQIILLCCIFVYHK